MPRETLKVLKDGGLRLLLVGYESGNQQILHNIKKGMRIDVAKKFSKDCAELGITIHGTFILGLPGETKETIQETIKFAIETNPHTLQVSLAAPYPGTFLFNQAAEKAGWTRRTPNTWMPRRADRAAGLPASVHTEIFDSVETFYRKFYFRAPKIASICGEMIRDRQMLVRRLREGVEFFGFLRERAKASAQGKTRRRRHRPNAERAASPGRRSLLVGSKAQTRPPPRPAAEGGDQPGAVNGFRTVTPRQVKPSCMSSLSSRRHSACAAAASTIASQDCSRCRVASSMRAASVPSVAGARGGPFAPQRHGTLGHQRIPARLPG